MERRKRRSFTPEFRAEAVRRVREGSKSLPQVGNTMDPAEGHRAFRVPGAAVQKKKPAN